MCSMKTTKQTGRRHVLKDWKTTLVKWPEYKAVYQVHAIPVKIPMALFAEIGECHLSTDMKS